VHPWGYRSIAHLGESCVTSREERGGGAGGMRLSRRAVKAHRPDRTVRGHAGKGMTHPYLRDAFPDILLNPLSVRRDLCGGYFFGLVCTRDFVHGRLSTLSLTATRGGRSLQRAFPRLFACPRQGLRAHMSDTSVPPPVRQRFLPSPLTPCPKVRLKYSPPPHP
jgi:hypothetical protein